MPRHIIYYNGKYQDGSVNGSSTVLLAYPNVTPGLPILLSDSGNNQRAILQQL
jgi:hypothetical protein